VNLRLVPRPAAAHGGRAGTPIDLSASLNPLGPHPAALEAARSCELGRYPEPDARSLVAAAAACHALDPAAVLPVPGAAWGLWLAAVALLAPGDRCLAIGPCFGEYRRCVEIAGAEYREVTAWPPAGRAAAVIVANPANPSGRAMSGAELRAHCDAHPRTWFVVDEAFASFAPAGTSLLDAGPPSPNVLVVRSLTKELALPGLRMGYVVAHPDLGARLAGILPSWPLSAPAISAAVAGLADRSHVTAGAEVGRRHVAELSAALASAGAGVFPSDVNYVLASAPDMIEGLRGRGITGRDCASFGLTGHVRLAAPRPSDMPAVLDAIAELAQRD
jgi:histidinol-phosphate/aromatic aminotransferase/cobyric acid decarboxylase-like protein